ncbi:MAG TPA: alpha-L-fucosidase [Pirellulales bacterium]|nr:alpha-L-fucosidase [Pirellulales bacterium]
MLLNRIKRLILALFCALVPAIGTAQTSSFQFQLPIAKGPFVGTMDSLKNYSCPEWFRDAKFGIWAHWGPQSVPMEGDWYARKMYQQGDPDYEDHLKRWGHPSTNGWKDIIPLWKAENWDPDKLMALYKKAGAKYFVSMASHHDNFFLWDSKLHSWNSVQMGPHRDVVGDWQKAAKKYGLPFGVSEHLGASFTWFQTSHDADKTGPLAGVPYDGANSKNWDLYHSPAEPGDNYWGYSKNQRWQQEWFNEIEELVDNYKPDLLYTDGGVAFGNEVGLSQIANFYNINAACHGGICEAVYTCKQPSDGRWVHDYERGVNSGIDPYPWQTDTSIGDWFYNKHWKYRPVKWVVDMLVDIVSKNGNLLLNVVQRPDGSLDPEVETMLQQLGEWTAANGEAIYGTRPWLRYGEGRALTGGGSFKEDFHYSDKDIRFTTKGNTLYAIALGWPEEGKLVIRSLARTDEAAQNSIEKVELLGGDGELKFSQTANGLAVELPGPKLSELTCALRITGSNLKPAPLPELSTIVSADSNGRLVMDADSALLHGTKLKLEDQGGKPDIGYWDDPSEWVAWRVRVDKPGIYKISASIAAANGNGEFIVGVGNDNVPAKVLQTQAWDQFINVEIGQVNIKHSGEVDVSVRSKDRASWKAINLNSVQLTPTDKRQ